MKHVIEEKGVKHFNLIDMYLGTLSKASGDLRIPRFETQVNLDFL